MKFLITLLIAIPTLIAILLFTIAGFAYNNPAMLAAEKTPLLQYCVLLQVWWQQYRLSWQ